MHPPPNCNLGLNLSEVISSTSGSVEVPGPEKWDAVFKITGTLSVKWAFVKYGRIEDRSDKLLKLNRTGGANTSPGGGSENYQCPKLPHHRERCVKRLFLNGEYGLARESRMSHRSPKY